MKHQTDFCDNSDFHASLWNVDDNGFNSDSLPRAVVAGRIDLERQQHTKSKDHVSAINYINACGSNKPHSSFLIENSLQRHL